jgi:hydrogenase maturation protease
MTAAVRTLLIGIGSPTGDDRLGWRMAQCVAAAEVDGLQVRQAATPLDLLDWLEGVDRLVLCDACLGAGPVGSVHRWQWPEFPTTAVRWVGSHDGNLLAVCQLADSLGWLPSDTTLWGVEVAAKAGMPERLDTALSSAAEQGAQRASRRIVAELTCRAAALDSR